MWERFWKFAARLGRRPATVSLLADDIALTIKNSETFEPAVIHWDDVDEIHTFKLDLGTIDDIRLAIHAGETWYELSEEDIGFMDVVKSMQNRFPTIPGDWYFEVMQPPFATNQRVLWRRG